MHLFDSIRAAGVLTGLMLGICLLHAVQPLGWLFGVLVWTDKFLIAIAGTVLYGLTWLGLEGLHVWDDMPHRTLVFRLILAVCIFGPLVGFSSVMVGTYLGNFAPDVFQAVAAVPQLYAWVVAYRLSRVLPQDEA